MLSNIYLRRPFQISSLYLKMMQTIVMLDKADPQFSEKADLLNNHSRRQFKTNQDNIKKVFKIIIEPDSVGTIYMLESHILLLKFIVNNIITFKIMKKRVNIFLNGKKQRNSLCYTALNQANSQVNIFFKKA